MNRIYMCIDLKSFYASVECVERGLDPLNTNLVVADASRTEKTICLAVSPSLKKYGISSRARLYEVISKVKKINEDRLKISKLHKFRSKSYFDDELSTDPTLELDYITAKPRMSHYIKYSTDIYSIYLKYISKEDIYVYSIDEVFCDITNYLKMYKKTPEELTTEIIKDVYDTTGITATAGIGTNMYLCKVAMDIVAKHTEPNEFGVRMAYLDEKLYRSLLWDHTPLKDFWRVGTRTEEKLSKYNIYTMGDIARVSLENEEMLYHLFGVNAEFLIDHAWGYEPVTMSQVKSYKPETKSISSSQVLHEPYDYNSALIIVKEMIDSVSLELVEKDMVTDQIVLTVTYDVENITKHNYKGEVKEDYYGRLVPKPAHGTINLEYKTSSSKILTKNIITLYKSIIDPTLLIRKITICVNDLSTADKKIVKQISLFDDGNDIKNIESEKRVQQAVIDVKNKYGKNAILKAINLESLSTAKDRNSEIGGHHE